MPRRLFLYLLMAAGFGACLWMVLAAGSRIFAVDAPTEAGKAAPHAGTILRLLVQVALILGLSRLMGLFFRKFHQPQVVGEMVAGIMLGPSLFGLLAPAASGAIFTPDTVPLLGALSQIGVIFFLFLVGLELDPKLISRRGHAAVAISHASIIAPFLLGAGLTLYLYNHLYREHGMPFTPVALFMGAAMSITAFPVLARILTERNLHKTKVGAVTITCAAVDDVTAWCMLAFVVAVARTTGLANAAITALLSAGYVALMFFVIKPFLVRLERVFEQQHNRLNQNIVAVILVLVLLSAIATEAIGIHALFGAFLMGAIMPKSGAFVRALSEKLEDFIVVLLLPIFFAYTGLKTRIGLLNNADLWLDTLLIILVACIGKYGGSAIAARFTGFNWREASAIGILMNTRGLMELVILNIGRDLGVIPDSVFAMMVIMALVTTALTTPMLALVYPRRLLDAELQSERSPARPRCFNVLVPISDPRSGGSLLKLADMLSRSGQPASRIFALHLNRPTDREAYRAGLDDSVGAMPSPAGPLAPLLAHAQKHNIPVEPVTFSSSDVAFDIAQTAEQRDADLILIGHHKPVFGRAILGGVVHRVMIGATVDVGVFVDRGFIGARRILVPYVGSPHDRLALQIAGRIGRVGEAAVTVLHVVPPGRARDAKTLGAKDAVDRTTTEPGQPHPMRFQVIEDEAPIDAVLREAANYDLIVIGVGSEWALESSLFGLKSERIAQDCPTSLLIVRRYSRPNAAIANSRPAAPRQLQERDPAVEL